MPPLIEEAASMSAPTLAFKGVAVDEGSESQIVDINETEGIVTAVVSVTGVKDDVDDVIEPGAYAETLLKRTPKVCWHHSWEKPVGRTLHIEELLPGDPRLPTKQRNGQPWPKEGGALVATMQFNLKSERGREAFEAVRFYSESGECEWSIGYQVPSGKSRRDKNGVRWIKAIDLFELSFVLFGAHNMTGTLALKAAALVISMHGKVTKAAPSAVVLSKDTFDQAIKALQTDDDPDQDDDEEDQDPPGDQPEGDSPADEEQVEGEDPGDEITDQPSNEQEVLLFDEDQGLTDATDSQDADDDDEDPEPPAAKALAAARLVIKSLSEADTDIEATCTCGDEVVFDTMNGWMRKDGSYSHDDGSTHSDHLDPPDDSELALAELKSIRGKGWQIDRDGTAWFEKVELTPLGQIKADQPGDGDARELIRWYVTDPEGRIRWPEKGSFDRCVKIARKHMTIEQAKGFCANRHHDATGKWPGSKRDKKAYPADSDLVDSPPPDQMANEDRRDPDDPHESGVMVALFPSPEAAEQLVVRGGEKADELHVTLAYLGKVSDDLGDGTTLGDATGRIVAAAQIAAATHQPLSGSIGGIGRFPDTGDGVPVWAPVDVVGLGALRESVVVALTDAGLPVKTDHGFTPHMTLGYNLDMSLITPSEGVPVSFDKMVVAVGGARTEVPIGQEPDAPVSGAPVAGQPLNQPFDDELKAAGYDPSIETGPEAGNRPATVRQQKMFPYIEGTYEERQQLLQQALAEALLPPGEDEQGRPLADRLGLNIEGTWPDRVVCTVHDWSDPASGSPGRQSWEVSYVINEDGSISLGEPEKVKLTVTAVDEEGGDLGDVPVGDLMPLAEMVEAVTGGVKAATSTTETKAGRVLSSANAQRLRAAVEHLISVLAAAGIEVGDPTNQGTASKPTVDTETTAPSARDGAVKALTPDEVAGTLAPFAELLET